MLRDMKPRRKPTHTPPAAIAAAFDPHRLTQARQLAHLARTEVATLIGVSPAAVGQYEAGITNPRPDIIPRLADALDVPVEFLTKGRPYAHLDVGDVHFDDTRTPAPDRAKAAALVEQAWELTHAIERHVQLPYVDLPGFAGGELRPTASNPTQAAREIRAAWNTAGPMPHLTRQLEHRGIIIATVPSDPRIMALGPHSASRLPRPVIVPTIGMALDVYRWRWELARQLGRLILHAESPAGRVGAGREASLFAAELLLPAREMGCLAGHLSTKRAVDLCRTWGVPGDALIVRRSQLGLVGGQQIARGKERVTAALSASQARVLADFPGEVPSIWPRAFDMAGLSVRGLAATLAWREARVSELLGFQDRRPVLRLVV